MSSLIVSNLSDGTLSIPTTYVTNGSAKAWVNFNGTGTIAARDSFNVSSLTDNGTGDYTVNFVNAMNNTNYSALATSFPRPGGTDGGILFGVSGLGEDPFASLALGSVDVASRRASSAGSNALNLDTNYASLAILGDLA